MPPTENQWANLVASALEVQQRAYAPYSRFTVGAAILSSSQKLYLGCNVENASYGLGICAERSAVSAMVSAGDRSISAIAIASVGAVSPCGACRQVLFEFGSEFEVLLVDSQRGRIDASWRMADLLPGAFGRGDLA